MLNNGSGKMSVAMQHPSSPALLFPPPRCLRRVWCKQASPELQATRSCQLHGRRRQLCRDSGTLQACVFSNSLFAHDCSCLCFLPDLISIDPCAPLMLSTAALTVHMSMAPPATSVISPCWIQGLAYVGGTNRMQDPGRKVNCLSNLSWCEGRRYGSAATQQPDTSSRTWCRGHIYRAAMRWLGL